MKELKKSIKLQVHFLFDCLARAINSICSISAQMRSASGVSISFCSEAHSCGQWEYLIHTYFKQSLCYGKNDFYFSCIAFKSFDYFVHFVMALQIRSFYFSIIFLFCLLPSLSFHFYSFSIWFFCVFVEGKPMTSNFKIEIYYKRCTFRSHSFWFIILFANHSKCDFWNWLPSHSIIRSMCAICLV